MTRPASRVPPGHHVCPACDRVVANRYFACGADWARLPAAIKREIARTARLNIISPDRIEAIRSALDFYGKD